MFFKKLVTKRKIKFKNYECTVVGNFLLFCFLYNVIYSQIWEEMLNVERNN